MKIDGKALADSILARLQGDVTARKTRGITPTLAVILVGDDPASLAYIRQKQKAADTIGARVIFDHQPAAIEAGKLRELVDRYNADPLVHGLIIQRPVPKDLGDVSTILNSVKPEKDVDGFLPGSPFDVPVAGAIGEILKLIRTTHHPISNAKDDEQTDYIHWLQSKNIVIIGRGDTAGKPINDYINRLLATSVSDVATKSKGFAASPKERRDSIHCTTSVIHSKTSEPRDLMKQADILISCVGKKQVITADTVKPGAILISVGLWRDEAGKLHGDYDEGDIADIASFYTPTPGGVGPVNVAVLMQNLVKACKINL